MDALAEIQAELLKIKQDLINLSKKAAATAKSVVDPDGVIHKQVQEDLDKVQHDIEAAFTAVKSTVTGWFK